MPASNSSFDAGQHLPLVTASITPLANLVSMEAAPVFRINRTPADGSLLEVQYTLGSYSAGEATSQDGAIVIPGETAHADVQPNRDASGSTSLPEIVVLTLQKNQNYQIGKRTVTLFTAKDGTNDAALLAAYQQGLSQEAFSALVARYQTNVFQTCYGVLGNRQDAEDVMQLVFLALAQQYIQLQTTLAGWLRRVARNAAIVVLRARRRRAHYEGQAATADLSFSDAATHELREELHATLALMPPFLQEAVRLRFLEGCSQKEAAALVGCPRGTLSQRAAKGIRSMRRLLADRGNIVGSQR
jgi:RNA polymerase sigma factor (sigma-70 family)